MKYFKYKKGFTLIELMVVIAIIGLLSSVVLASLNSAKTSARNAKRLSDLKNFTTVFELAVDDSNEYPSSGGTGWVCLGYYSDNRCWQANIQKNDVFNNTLLNYLSAIPESAGYVGLWEGTIYRCVLVSPCRSIHLAWFMEGANQSCGQGKVIDSNYQSRGVTYCEMRRSF